MSETTGGWFLTHGDGEVHGPFRLPALVDGARLGNILPTTQLRHETHTGGQWLPASRIRPVAEAIIAKQAASQSPPAESPPQSQPQPQTRPQPQSQPQPQSPTRPQPQPQPSQPQPQSQPEPQPQPQSQREPQFQPPPTAARQETSAVAPASAAAEVGVEVQKKTRIGTGKGSLTVPETFGAALLALFDFRFRYFVTPWIIKITWGICVAVTLTWLLLFTIAYVIQPIVSSAESELSSDVVMTEDSSSSRARARNNWEFQPPTSVSENMGRVITYIVTVLFCSLGLLYVRVLMEMAIVVFRIAIDLGDVKEVLREK